MNNLQNIEKGKNTAVLSMTGQATYDQHVKRFGQWLKLHQTTANKDSVVNYLEQLSKSKAASTVINYKQAIKKSLSMRVDSIEAKAKLDAIFKDIRIAKPDKKVYLEQTITTEDSNTVARNLKGIYKIAYLALEATGMRVSELTEIKKKDCKVTKDAVAIQITGKGKKQRRVFLSKQLYQQALATTPSKSEYLFSGAYGGKLYRQHVTANITNAGAFGNISINSHKLRHTFASRHILKNEGSIKRVSNYLGHSSAKITVEMYLHDQMTAQEALQFTKQAS